MYIQENKPNAKTDVIIYIIYFVSDNRLDFFNYQQ